MGTCCSAIDSDTTDLYPPRDNEAQPGVYDVQVVELNNNDNNNDDKEIIDPQENKNEEKPKDNCEADNKEDNTIKYKNIIENNENKNTTTPKKATNINTSPQNSSPNKQSSHIRTLLSSISQQSTPAEKVKAREDVKLSIRNWWELTSKGQNVKSLQIIDKKLVDASFTLAANKKSFTVDHHDGVTHNHQIHLTDVTRDEITLREYLNPSIDPTEDMIRRSCLLKSTDIGKVFLFVFEDEDAAAEFFLCYKLTKKVITKA
eukprot:GHVR01054887.1.p1 GENE.GHVR01054887.1~~GHVR01054887.1.p1  ORF type:complete len:260 (+),score=71.91 GHVR01054887.1:60-839(+)